MKEHKWEIEEIDGGHMGIGHFWKCDQCGASGGPVMGKEKGPPTFRPFLAGLGPSIKLGDDCDISARLIEALKYGIEFGKNQRHGEVTALKKRLKRALQKLKNRLK